MFIRSPDLFLRYIRMIYGFQFPVLLQCDISCSCKMSSGNQGTREPDSAMFDWSREGDNSRYIPYGGVRHKDFCYDPIPDIWSDIDSQSQNFYQILIPNPSISKKLQKQFDVKGIKDRGLGTIIFVASGHWNEFLI